MAIPDQLIEKLMRLTRQSKLKWERVGSESFKCEAGNFFVAARQYGMGLYGLTIYDEDGIVVDDTTASQSDIAKMLYEAARQMSPDVDRKLADLEEALAHLEND
jgi:hypothetical protein